MLLNCLVYLHCCPHIFRKGKHKRYLSYYTLQGHRTLLTFAIDTISPVHPDRRALSSEWFLNSFIMVVYDNCLFPSASRYFKILDTLGLNTKDEISFI